jgi:hypothetical protein
LCLLSPFALAQDSAQAIYAKVAPSTVFIKTDKGAGTGFFALSNGTLFTAFHVIDGATRVSIKTHAGDIYDDVTLIAKDERRDIAVLKVRGFDLPTVPLGNSSPITPGQKVYVIGNPLGAEKLKATITDGIVSGIRDFEDGYKVIQVTAPISPGNSGGPALDEKGNAVGIVVFRLTQGESLNFAVPINYARGLLDGDDGLKPLKQFSKTDADVDLFAISPYPKHWKSLTNGASYTLRFSGDFIYADRVPSDEDRELGYFMTYELKKNGESYTGVVRRSLLWIWEHRITGVKTVTDRCTMTSDVAFDKVTPTRIEGHTLDYPRGAKYNMKKCTLSGKPFMLNFVWVPE